MQITIDTNNLSALDISTLTFLTGAGPTPEEAVPVVALKPEPVKRAKKATPAPAPVIEPEPEAAPVVEPEEDLLGGEEQAVTMADAVAAATKLVTSGNAAKVKEALAAAAGAKRVSEVAAEDLAAFVAALSA